jgi:hypothetical protein
MGNTSGRSSARAEDPTEPQRWLTPGVAAVGTASFLADAGHELLAAIQAGGNLVASVVAGLIWTTSPSAAFGSSPSAWRLPAWPWPGIPQMRPKGRHDDACAV